MQANYKIRHAFSKQAITVVVDESTTESGKVPRVQPGAELDDEDENSYIWQVKLLDSLKYTIKRLEPPYYAAASGSKAVIGQLKGQKEILWNIRPQEDPGDLYTISAGDKYWTLDDDDESSPVGLEANKKDLWKFEPQEEPNSSSNKAPDLKSKSVDELVPFLNSVHHKIQILAAERLKSAVGDSRKMAKDQNQVLTALVWLLCCENRQVRCVAAGVVGVIADKAPAMITVLLRVISALVPLLGNEDSEVSNAASATLRKIVAKAGTWANVTAVDENVVEDVGNFLDTTSVEIQVTACGLLNAFADPGILTNNVVGTIIRLLSSDDSRLPDLAAKLLQKVTRQGGNIHTVTSSSIPDLVKSLSANSKVAIVACDALWVIIDHSWSLEAREVVEQENVIGALVKLLASNDPAVLPKASAILKSLIFKDTEAINVDSAILPDLVKLLSSPHNHVLTIAFHILRYVCWDPPAHGSHVIAPLIRSLKSSNPEVQESAILALESITQSGWVQNDGVEDEGIPRLVKILKSTELGNAACHILANITQHSEHGRAVAFKASAIPELIRMVASDVSHPSAPEALLYIATFDPKKTAVSASKSIEGLVCLSRSDNVDVQRNAVEILATTTWNSLNAKHAAITIPVLVAAMADSEVQKIAAGALQRIVRDIPGQAAAPLLDCIQPLASFLASDDVEVQTATCETLARVIQISNIPEPAAKFNTTTIPMSIRVQVALKYLLMSLRPRSLTGVGIDNNRLAGSSLPFWTAFPNGGPLMGVLRMPDGTFLGIGMDKSLYTKENFSWALVPVSENLKVIAATVLSDQTILGVGGDSLLYTRPSLQSEWSVVPRGSITAVATLRDGVILGLSSGYLYKRQTVTSPWEYISNSYYVAGVAVLPDSSVIGIGLDQQLYRRSSLYDQWVHVPNSGKVIAITVLPNSTILGVSVDNKLQTRATLSSAWVSIPGSGLISVAPMNDGRLLGVDTYNRLCIFTLPCKVHNSGDMIAFTLLQNGTILGIGTNNQLYTRATLSGTWVNVPDSGSVISVAQLSNGWLLGVGLDKKLRTRSTLDSPWTSVADSGDVTCVTVLPNGMIVGVGTNRQLLTRITLTDPWVPVPNSGEVTSISAQSDGSLLGIGSDNMVYTTSGKTHIDWKPYW